MLQVQIDETKGIATIATETGKAEIPLFVYRLLAEANDSPLAALAKAADSVADKGGKKLRNAVEQLAQRGQYGENRGIGALNSAARNGRAYITWGAVGELRAKLTRNKGSGAAESWQANDGNGDDSGDQGAA
jgi:hypothetical protein